MARNQKEIEAVIEQAKKKSAKGMDTVVWANRLNPKARHEYYGFNFHPKGAFKVGQKCEGFWSGIREGRAVCEVLAII